MHVHRGGRCSALRAPSTRGEIRCASRTFVDFLCFALQSIKSDEAFRQIAHRNALTTRKIHFKNEWLCFAKPFYNPRSCSSWSRSDQEIKIGCFASRSIPILKLTFLGGLLCFAKLFDEEWLRYAKPLWFHCDFRLEIPIRVSIKIINKKSQLFELVMILLVLVPN